MLYGSISLDLIVIMKVNTNGILIKWRRFVTFEHTCTIFRYLDLDAPTLSAGCDRREFSNLVLLFYELICHDVFSHDSYLCRQDSLKQNIDEKIQDYLIEYFIRSPASG